MVFRTAGLWPPQLARIGAARAGHAKPRLAAWLGEEMRRASETVLRGAA